MQENSVWRKFCRRCGVNILGFRIGRAIESQGRFERDISGHQAAIARIGDTLHASRRREKLVKAIIFGLGTVSFVALFFGGHYIIGTIVGLITLAWGGLYESSEGSDLVALSRLHMNDLDRLIEKKRLNDDEIASLYAIGADLSPSD